MVYIPITLNASSVQTVMQTKNKNQTINQTIDPNHFFKVSKEVHIKAQCFTSLNEGDRYLILKALREAMYTVREIVKECNSSNGNIQFWLKKLNLKTVNAEFDGNPINRLQYELLPLCVRVIHVDITEFSIKPSKTKKKRITVYSALTAEIDNKRYAFIYHRSAIHNTLIIIKHLREIAELHNCYCVTSDKEFHYLPLEGFEWFKTAEWNCSKLVNEKHYGNLKRWIYPKLRYLKKLYKINDANLMLEYELVKTIYYKQMRQCGFIINDYIATENLKELTVPCMQTI